jgi:hypothetical protein
VDGTPAAHLQDGGRGLNPRRRRWRHEGKGEVAAVRRKKAIGEEGKEGDWADEVACSLPARRRAGRASHDPWIKNGSAGGPHALDETAGRDRATSPQSDGPKSKRL